MKQKLLNKFWLRVGMIVAVMTTALAGTVKAEDKTITLDYNSFGLTTSYSKKTATVDGIGFTVDQGYKGSGNTIQMNSSKGSGILYNTTPISGLKSIKVNVSSGDKTYTITTGTSEKPTANSQTGTTGGTYNAVSGDTYFQLKVSGASYFSSIVITYDDSGSSTLTDSDLALTGSTSLSFDLYDNSSAQTLSYTTSSTGAVTVSGNDYVTAVVDETNKIITVTPNTLVTPSVQTITVNQAADDTYKIGTATFTVTITDSTPDPYIWVETLITDLTASDVFVIVGNNSGNTFYAMTNDNGTSGAPQAPTVTITDDKITSRVDDNFKWNLDGNETDGYSFSPNGSTGSYLYCNTTANSSSNDNMRVGSGSRKLFVMDNNDHLKTNDNNVPRYVSVYTSGPNWRGYVTASTTVKFYKRVDASAPLVPSFTITNNDELAYGATSGSFGFTVNNPVTGGVTSVSENVDWISNAAISGNIVSFTTTENEAGAPREGIITLTYSYGDNQTITENVTVTQAAAPVIYTTIPALFEDATSTETEVNITFGGWVVSGVSGKNAYLTDNQGHGLIIYASGHGFEVGDVLTGTVSCKLQLYRGSAELTNLTNTTTGLTVTSGGSVTEATIAMADLAGVNTGALVSYENLTCSVTTSGNYTNYDLTDGTTTIRAYTTLYDFTSTPDLEDGKTYNIKGIFLQYTTSSSSTKEILPRSAADIEEVVSTTPSIVVDPDEVSEDAEEHEGTLAITYENLTITDMTDFDVQFCDEDGNGLDAALDWIMVEVAEAEGGEGYVVSYIMDANTGDARTAYFKVYAMDDDTNLVYSNLVTVTQAAYVAPFVVEDGVFDFVQAASKNENYGSGIEPTTDGQHYETEASTWTAGNVTLVASGKYRWWSNDGTLRFYANTPTSAMTISVPEGNVITKIVITGGQAFAADCGNYSSGNWTGYSNSVVLTSTSNSSVNVKTITVTYVEACQPATVTLNAQGYATFASTSAVDFTNAETNGYSAWAVTAVSGTEITFSQITGAVAAGTGVLLKGTASAQVTIAYTTSGATLSDNKLEGVVAPKAIEFGQYYGLKGNTFVKVNTGIVPAGKALLPATAVNGEVKAFTFNFDEDATAIKAIDNGQLTTDGVIYNVAGQRLSKMQKGINIVNGKKILK